MTPLYKTLFILSITIFSSILFYNCGQSPKEQKSELAVQPSLKPSQKDSSRYPNDDSELAWLMRDMYQDGEKIKMAIQSKQLPEDFREKFKNIHTATPTDAAVKGEVFDTSAKVFLQTLDKFYAEKENQIENFNLVVNACVACHQNYCPGPIKKIKKLAIK
ncbi:MAG: hypothetical protein EAZ08_14040 [Cytophagales bacterium]|nr:MAG: hypothetical protein EAZ08_14040 [Cytophagales bacterium]